MLLEALEASKLAKSEEYTGRALVELAELERNARRPRFAKAYCEEAVRTAPLTNRLETVCRPPEAMTQDEQISGLRLQIRAMEDEIRRDLGRFQMLRRAATMHQHLARILHERGHDAEARAELEKASRYLDDLVRRDRDNEPVRKQATRARRALEQLSQ